LGAKREVLVFARRGLSARDRSFLLRRRRRPIGEPQQPEKNNLCACLKTRSTMADTQTDDDRTEHPLVAAVLRNDLARVRELMRKKTATSFSAAAAASASASASNPTATPFLPTQRHDGATLLHLAQSPEMVNALFEAGGQAIAALANVGYGRYSEWRVPLCDARNAAVARALIDHGCDPRGAGREYRRGGERGAGAPRLQHAGQTPLGEAAARLDSETVALLLERGAPARPLNGFGQSATDRAFVTRSFLLWRQQGGSGGALGGAGGAGPSWAAGAAVGGGGGGGGQENEENEEDEEDEEDDDQGDEKDDDLERLQPHEAHDRFISTLRALLRGGAAVSPGYLREALSLLAPESREEREARLELERRRRDPRLTAMAREEVAGLAADMLDAQRSEQRVEAMRARLAAAALAEVEKEEDEEEEEDGDGRRQHKRQRQDEGAGGGGGGGGGDG